MAAALLRGGLVRRPGACRRRRPTPVPCAACIVALDRPGTVRCCRRAARRARDPGRSRRRRRRQPALARPCRPSRTPAAAGSRAFRTPSRPRAVGVHGGASASAVRRDARRRGRGRSWCSALKTRLVDLRSAAPRDARRHASRQLPCVAALVDRGYWLVRRFPWRRGRASCRAGCASAASSPGPRR